MSAIGSMLAAATLTLALAGCGNDDGAEPAADQTAANGDVFNTADVEFATQMIPHHAQALEMVDLTVGRDLTPETAELVESIRAAQTPEVEQMTDWLTAWDQEVPATSLDHSNAEGEGEDMEGMEGMEDMPGMMSSDEMAALADAPDAEFEQMFLEMMIEHHTGAVEMAETEQEEGQFAEAITLAEGIESGQTAEISEMETILGS